MPSHFKMGHTSSFLPKVQVVDMIPERRRKLLDNRKGYFKDPEASQELANQKSSDKAALNKLEKN